jgi:RHS repeat-associated protein
MPSPRPSPQFLDAPVAGDGSYTGTLTASLPGLVSGSYYAIVKTNVFDNQPETDFANNTGVSTDTVNAQQPILTLGTPVTGTLSTGAMAYYQFTVAAGETVNLAMTSDTAGTANDIYASYEAIPTIGQFDATSSVPVTQDPNAVIQETQPGTYYVMIDESAGATETYTLTATALVFSITGITPDQGSNLGSVTLTISGADFTANDVVDIVAPDGTVLQASKVYWVNGGELWATFDLQGAAVGEYGVRVVDGAQTTSLSNGFAVTNGPAGHLSVSLVAPSQLQTHSSPDGLTGTQNGIVTIQYSNDGETDIPAPILDLQATNAEFQSGAAGLVSPSEITVVGTNQTGPAGILQPGGQEAVSYTFAGNFGYAQFIEMTLSLGVLDGSNATIDWTSLEQSMQPASIDDTDWNLIWTRFEAQVGSTTQSLVDALSQVATTLSQIGDTTTDLGTLLNYELEQASGALPNTTLAQTTDLSDSGTGIDLSLTRTYSASLLDRNNDGAFGEGWTFTYGIKAITDGSGDVSIVSPAGTELFTLGSGGSYTAQAGDTSTLTLSNGSYVLTDESGTVERFRPDGQIASITDANGNVVTVTYDSSGVINGVTSSNGQSLTFTTDSTGQITSATDGSGRTVTYTYDPTGEHLLSVSGPSGTTSYSYDASGNPLTDNALTGITNPDGTTQTFAYDSEGSLSSQSGSAGADAISYSYDGPGVVVETDGNSDATTLIYDTNGNLAEVQDAAGDATRLTYDSNGDLTGVVGPDGSTYNFAYDASGNLTSYTDPLGGTVKATYASGTNELTSFMDQDGNATDYSYDSAGDLTGITYDNGSGTTYQYAADGALTQTTDARGQTTDYTYNASGELTNEAFSDGTSQSYAYDSHGDLIADTATDGGVTDYTYNAAGELTSVTDPEGRVESYGYNSAGQEIQRMEPDGSITNYTYTANGQISGLTDGSGNLLVDYTYNGTGQLIAANMGNGASTSYSYGSLGNVTQIQTLASDGSVTGQLDYTYNSDSQPIKVTSLDGTWTYNYDAEGELTHAVFTSTNVSIPDQDLTYVYDAAGNRTQTIFNGAVTNYTTNGLNQYTSANGTTYDYDADGNLISMTNGAQTTTYGYNSQNQLISETDPDGTKAYEYDALGNQVSSTVNGVQTDYVIDPLAIFTPATGPLSAVAQVYNAAGNATATYEYGNGLAAVTTNTGTNYYNTDAIGNVTSLSGDGGNLLDTYDYTPFGIIFSSSGSFSNPFEYSGALGVVTNPSGLIAMGGRYYSPLLGRFVSLDPTGILGGLNLYSYADNSPVSLSDPTGTEPSNGKESAPSSWWLSWLKSAWEYLGPDSYPGKLTGMFYEIELPSIVDGPLDEIQSVVKGAAANPQATAYGVQQSLALPQTVDAILQPGANIGEIIEQQAAGAPKGYLKFPEQPVTNFFLHIFGVDTSPLEKTVANVHSTDPNEILGPAGYGTQAFVAASATDAYTIDFTNAATATAPAQAIVITEQLDASLDWRTFRLTGFAFDNLTSTLSGNQAFYSGLLDYSATKGFDVQVTAGVNVVTGVVTWTFQTIDPATGQPPANPELGLLPPDDQEGDGEGSVSYTIQPKAGLQTGDTVAAQATVIFDTNAPINTPAIVNTIDAVAPTSAVKALPSIEASPSFEVSWSGTDDPAGSGIANYTIEVSEDGAAPTQWLVNTTRTNAIFTGDPGHSYVFWSSATDNAGNVQLLNAAPDTETQIACFMAGTRIATEHGDVAVESLNVGDYVRALAAAIAMPIKWIGHRSVDCERHLEPKQVWPVRILAGAFSAGRPGRDLWLSPDHAVFVDGVLIPIRLLINGTTVAQIAMPAVTYFHIELEQHDILIADGLPAESYLDTGNRTTFENAVPVMDLHPDFSGVERARHSERQTVAPLAVRPDQTEPVWRRLVARAKALGQPAFEQQSTSDAELQLVVGGRAIRPVAVTDGRYVFVVSPKTEVVQIMSRSAAPSDIRPWLDDRRRLGVSIGRIVLNGASNMSEIPVDHPTLDSGWHDTECDGQKLWRWTNGDARLPIPVGTRVIEIQLHGQTEYRASETKLAA